MSQYSNINKNSISLSCQNINKLSNEFLNHCSFQHLILSVSPSINIHFDILNFGSDGFRFQFKNLSIDLNNESIQNITSIHDFIPSKLNINNYGKNVAIPINELSIIANEISNLHYLNVNNLQSYR